MKHTWTIAAWLMLCGVVCAQEQQVRLPLQVDALVVSPEWAATQVSSPARDRYYFTTPPFLYDGWYGWPAYYHTPWFGYRRTYYYPRW